METQEMQEYWRWRLFRVLAEYIHEPNRMNTSRLNLFTKTYYYEYMKATGQETGINLPEDELAMQDAG